MVEVDNKLLVKNSFLTCRNEVKQTLLNSTNQ